MHKFRIRLSLRYKLLLLLTTIPLASLGAYLFMATDLFQKDKVAYVFDSSATVSRSLATQMRIELQGAYSSLRTVVEHFDFNQRQFSDVANDLFSKNHKIMAIMLFKREPSGEYAKLGQLVKDEKEGKGAPAFAVDDKLLTMLREQAVQNGTVVSENAATNGALNLAFRLGEQQDADHMVVIALYRAEDIADAFTTGGMYASMVMTRAGQVSIAGGADTSPADLSLLRELLNTKINEGTAERKMQDNLVYLISYASVGLGDLTVVSKVDKAKALKAVEVLVTKSLLFFIVLFASTLLISIFASNQLTSALRELFDATTKIAQGDFTVRIEPRSSDEVGGLAQSFNYMAGEVSRLMSETAESARMQNELATVKTVQETLFPPAQVQFGPLRIRGHFEPASECGGDWWSYSRVGNKIFMWIGDATGHGAPAALITSAARSAAAVIEGLPDMSPGRALSIMNRAIQMTSKGQIMMTFFLGSIDLDRNTFTYASASHDPPYMLRKTGHKLSRRDLVPLNEVNGPRLGEQKDFQYKEVAVEFNPGDMVFLYTDGIMDVENGEGKKIGERTFLKSLIDSANISNRVDAKVENLCRILDDYRAGSELIDDVTLVMCEYETAVTHEVAA